MKLTTERIHEAICELARVDVSERSGLIAKLATEWKVTAGTVYRRIKQRMDESRRTRTVKRTAGEPKVVSKSEIRYYVEVVMGLKSLDPSKPDKRIPNPNKALSTERAIEIAVNMGIIPAGVLTIRTVNRWAQKLGLRVHDICAPRPAVKLVSAYPNQVHVIDFSVCEQYYLRDSDGKVLTRPWTYKNKPNESRIKIWAFALVDHYSSVKFIKYFLSPGESSDILYQGITDAWEKKEDSQFPFHGAPKIMYADKGSAIRSGRIQNFLDALGIKVIMHKPGNPRAKGMVERAFRTIQQQLENELRFCPVSSVEELNERAYNWLVYHNWKKNGDGRSRFEVWQEITDEQLLELPSRHIMDRVAATGELRKVDRYCAIRFKNQIHGVPPELVGKTVRVWTDIDGGLSVQDIETGEMYPVCERRTAKFGEYHAYKRTESERMQDEALALANEIRKEITPEVLRREVPNIHAIPREGTAVEMDSPFSPRSPRTWGRGRGMTNEGNDYETVYQAKKAIAEELKINLGDLPDWMLEEIEVVLRETLDRGKVQEIADYVGEFMRGQEAV